MVYCLDYRVHSKDSIVLAIYGDWGAGKTSLKNLILEELKSKPPLLMDFNPWQRAGNFDIFEIFFKELSIIIGKEDKGKKYKELAKKIKNYGRYLSAGKSIFTAFKSLCLGILLVF